MSRPPSLPSDEVVGIDLVRRWTDAVDEWLASIWVEAGAPRDCALAAVGGYGRGELCPKSDIDLILLHRGRDDLETVASRIWYPVWDAGMKLGHSVRTVKEAARLASADLATATSLLATRHIAGDEDLTGELARTCGALWRKRSRRWLEEIASSIRARHERFGDIAFVLEPDLKEGRGGLRDVQAIGWAVAADAVDLDLDQMRLAEAHRLVLAVRAELHRITGRASDLLALQEQEGVARALGFPDADALVASLAQAARTISVISDEVWHAITRTLTAPRGWRSSRDRDLGSGLVLREGLVDLSAEARPERDSLIILRAAVAAAKNQTRITSSALARLAAAPTPPTPWPPEARNLFLELLTAGSHMVPVVESLDERGIWARLLPEWQDVRNRPQRNAYHRFTVDRHLLETVAEAARLSSRVARPDLLSLAALFHDIGKVGRGDHSEVGAQITRTVMARMGFSPKDVEVVEALVRHHLLLADVATRRDLSEPRVIKRVAGIVGDPERLELLAALTEADSIATGPAAWGSWKKELVDELTSRTRHLLQGGDVDHLLRDDPRDRELRDLLRRRERVVQGSGTRLVVADRDRPGLFASVAGALALAGVDVLGAVARSEDGRAAEIFEVRAGHAGSIDWQKVLEVVEKSLDGRLALDARLAQRASVYGSGRRPRRATPVEVEVRFDNESAPDATVVEIRAPDGVGVLYRITRALTDMRLNIRSAKVQTMLDEVVDAFVVERPEGPVVDESLMGEIETAIVHALGVGAPSDRRRRS